MKVSTDSRQWTMAHIPRRVEVSTVAHKFSRRVAAVVAMSIAILATTLAAMPDTAQAQDTYVEQRQMSYHDSFTVLAAAGSSAFRVNEIDSRAQDPGVQFNVYVRNLPWGDTMEFDLVIGGSAVLGEDYRIHPSDIHPDRCQTAETTRCRYRVRGSSGWRQSSLSFTIMDDRLDEGSYETLSVTVENLSRGRVNGPARFTLQIRDDDDPFGEVALVRPSYDGTITNIPQDGTNRYSVSEGDSRAKSSGVRVAACVDFAVSGTATYRVNLGGTATIAQDYSLHARDVNSGEFQTSESTSATYRVEGEQGVTECRTFTVVVRDDPVDERQKEEITITLETVSGVRLGTPSEIGILIRDNDEDRATTFHLLSSTSLPSVLSEDLFSAERGTSSSSFQRDKQVEIAGRNLPRKGATVLEIRFGGTARYGVDYVVRAQKSDPVPEGMVINQPTSSNPVMRWIIWREGQSERRFWFRVKVLDDSIEEDTESIVITFDPGNLYINGRRGAQTRTVRIFDNDRPAPATEAGITFGDTPDTISENLSSHERAAAGNFDASNEVTLNIPRYSVVLSFSFEIEGTAFRCEDYIVNAVRFIGEGSGRCNSEANTAIFRIAARATSFRFRLKAIDDSFYESDGESLVINLGRSNDGGSTTKRIGVLSNDEAPVLSISSPRAVEGDTGETTALEFEVSLEGDTARPVTVDYAIAAESTAGMTGDGDDYEHSARSPLAFAVGETTKLIEVTINGDDLAEVDETVIVRLTSPVNAMFADGASTVDGIGTINDDDELKLSISDETATEGDAGETTTMTFTVTLGKMTPADLAVSYMVSGGNGNGEATAGTDFTAASGTFTFTNEGPLTQTFGVSVTGDDLLEANETFTVTLSNPQCSGCPVGVVPSLVSGEGTATGTILDNEAVQISITNPAVNEGDAGDTPTLDFEVRLSHARDQNIAVSYSVVSSGTAVSGTDFEALADGTLTFDAAMNEVSKAISVTLTGDAVFEEDETVVVELSNPTGSAVLAGSASTITGTGTITNDDDAPVLAFGASPTVVEGGSGSPATLRFEVTKTGATDLSATFSYAIAESSTATVSGDGADIAHMASSPITLSAAETMTMIEVAVVDDAVFEGNETVIVTLSSPVNAAFASQAATIDGIGTITNDDDAPVLAFGRLPTVTEGDVGGTTMLRFEVTKEGATAVPAMVSYSITGTATSTGNDADFSHSSASFAIPADQNSDFINIAVRGDDLTELDETVIVTLSSSDSAKFADDEPTIVGTGTIVDDDSLLVTLEAEDVVEGQNGETASMTFTAALAARSLQPVTVNYTVLASGSGSGTASHGPGGAGDDYTADAPTGTLTFAPDVAAPQLQSFSVTVHGDDNREPNETVSARLHGLSADAEFEGGPSVTEILATGTILNDDSPSFTVGPARVDEGGEGETAILVFEVTMAPVWNEAVTVDYEAAGGTAAGEAAAGEDFGATSGTLTYNIGETVKTVSVEVLGDSFDEADEETVTLLLSNASPNANIYTADWTGVIIDDDDPPAFSIDSPLVEEGDSDLTDLVFTVFKIGDTRLDSSVAYTLADGTAIGGEVGAGDYVPTAGGQLFFAPEEASKTITVQVRGDILAEVDETVTVMLSDPTGATLETNGAEGTGTVVNDDDLALSIDSPSVTEGDTRTVTLSFTVTLEAETPENAMITVDYEVISRSAAGEATEGTDFMAVSGMLAFTPGGGLTREIKVEVFGDTIPEGSETLTATLSNPACGMCSQGVEPRIETGVGTGTIKDNDASLVRIGTPSVIEGDAREGTTLDFEVTLDIAWDRDVSVDYSVTGGTAFSGTDFEVLADGRLTFDSSQKEVSKTIQIRVIGDTEFEEDETVVVTLSDAMGGAIFISGLPSIAGTGTIVNDDFNYVVEAPSGPFYEPDSGTKELVFNVTLSPEPTSAFSVRYIFGGTAAEGFDFSDATQTAAEGALTFEAGETSKSIRTLVQSDFVAEVPETVIVTLVDGAGVPIPSTAATATILPSQAVVDPVTLEVASPQVAPGEGEGTPEVEFALRLSETLASPIAVNWVLSVIMTEEAVQQQASPFSRGVAARNVSTSELESGTAVLSAGMSVTTATKGIVGIDRESIDGHQLVIELERPVGADGVEVRQSDEISGPLQAAVDSNGRVAVAVFDVVLPSIASPSDRAATGALAAFGRSTATSLVSAVWSRVEMHRHGGTTSHVNLGGRSVDVSAFASGTNSRIAAWETARILGIETVSPPSPGNRAGGSPVYSGDLDDFKRWADFPDSDHIAGGSSFALALDEGPSGGSSVVYWGAGSNGSFGIEMEEDGVSALSIDGSTTTLTVGLDYRTSGSMLLGLAVSNASGTVEYSYADTQDGDGELSPSLTSVAPWLRLKSAGGTEFWAAVGIGSGSAEAVHGEVSTDMDLSSQTVAAGFWNPVATYGSAGIAVKADAFTASLSTEGAGELVDGAGADSKRIRLAAEMAPRQAGGIDRPLSYAFELGARQDSGDAGSGVGFDAAARFAYASPSGGVQLSGRGSVLLTHGKEEFSETGLSLAIAYDPGGDSRGFHVSLEPAWNAPLSNSADSLWNADSSGDMSPSSSDSLAMSARLGYGLGAIRERTLATLYGESEAGESYGSLRLGAKVQGRKGALERLSLDLYGEREERRFQTPEQAIMLEARVGF